MLCLETYGVAMKDDEKNKSMSTNTSYTFQLPLADSSQTQQLSRGAQEIVGRMAQKQAEKQQAALMRLAKVRVIPKQFTGETSGRIETDGRIYDSAGQHIMSIDKENGDIRLVETGQVVGNYSTGSTYSEHRIVELIGMYSTTNNSGWYAGGSQQAYNGNGSGNWGKETNSCGNASIWGSADNGEAKDDNSWW